LWQTRALALGSVALPIYEYHALAPCAASTTCNGNIEVFASMSAPELLLCPTCGVAIERVISAPSMAVSGSHHLKEKHFSERGFTQYRKAGGGVYEKTAGDGPKFISDDGK
jgi:putative FmdB family regulatory protein